MATFTPLHDVLAHALGDVARRTTQAAALTPVWREAVGELAARQTSPVSLEAGLLRVKASQAAWVEALSAQSPKLIARLNALLGPGQVERIELFVGA